MLIVRGTRTRRARRSLLRDTSGVSLLEFALLLPIVTMIGIGGLEYVNLVLANQKIERIASTTADTISRNTMAPTEKTFVDTFLAVDKIGKPFAISPRGRTILTGVIGANKNGTVVNKVVWQRCAGSLSTATSRIGTEWTSTTNYGDGPDVVLPNGVVLLQNQMVVVSEVAYRYEPLISLAQLSGMPSDGVIRQRSMFVTRGQAFPSITPSNGITAPTCV